MCINFNYFNKKYAFVHPSLCLRSAFVLPSLQVRSIEWEENGTYKGIT